jgi:hypothetical protein
MSIHWIAAETDDVNAILEAVDYAIAHDVRGAPPASGRPIAVDATDRYLDESITLAEATWAIDAGRVVPSHRPLIGALFGALQRLTQRLLWWHTAPRWEQITTHQGAATRVLAVLVHRDREQRRRITWLEREVERLAAVERPMLVMSIEQRELRRRIAELEQRLEQRADG